MPDVPEGINADASPRTNVSPVDAHLLLNSASVVLLGLDTLDDKWDSLAEPERRDQVARIRRHAVQLAVGLKQLIQPETL